MVEKQTLMERVKASGTIKDAAIMSESKFFNDKDMIPLGIPILNAAFSGSLDGGLVPGLTVVSGASKTFKTMLGLVAMRAYLNKYKDAIAILYDNEFGSPPSYLASLDIDTDRLLHVPFTDIENLKFDMVKRLQDIKRGDKVYILVDSLGSAASKKEVEDAENSKAVADMSRAKSIRSWLRIVVPHFTLKDIPCIVINHVYKTMDMYPTDVIPGGTAVTYSPDQVFIITKQVEKDDKTHAIESFNFIINIRKSRYVKEGSKFPIKVSYDNGISKYSGFFDLAMQAGLITKGKPGWYHRVDSDGVVTEPGFQRSAVEDKSEFWLDILGTTDLKRFVVDKFKMATTKLMQEDAAKSE
jgi:hypothetical protein